MEITFLIWNFHPLKMKLSHFFWPKIKEHYILSQNVFKAPFYWCHNWATIVFRPHGERKAESEAAGETGSEVAVGTGSEATADGTYSIVSFTFLKKYLVNNQSFF